MSAPVDAARALVSTRLPSWRPGSSRDAVLTFLDDLDHVPIDERVAYIDNDGTMWCEKPTYVQFDFFVDALQRRVDADPSMADRPEFAAVLAGDMAAIGEIGLANVAAALAALFDGETPDDFAAAVADFLDRHRHPTLHRELDGIIYQPMLELLDALRDRGFTIGIVTGGGTEFVRQISKRCYDVEPGMVVGTLIGYTFDRDDAARPVVRRTIAQIGSANEGGAKMEHRLRLAVTTTCFATLADRAPSPCHRRARGSPGPADPGGNRIRWARAG